MNLAMSVLVAVSVGTGLLKRRFNWVGLTITIIIFSIILADGILALLGSGSLSQYLGNQAFVTLIALETILILFLEKSEKSSVVPSYSIPILTIVLFSNFLLNINIENTLSWVCVALLIYPLWSTGQLTKKYFEKRVIVGFVVFILALTAFTIYGLKEAAPIFIFLYWYSSNLIPLGLDKDTSSDPSFPLVNRVILISLYITKTDIVFSYYTYITALIFLGITSMFSMMAMKDKKKSWILLKRTGEAMLLVIGLSQQGLITEEIILAILSFSIVTYVPRLSINISKTGNLMGRFVYVLAFLFCSGLLIGRPTELIQVGLRDATLMGMGTKFLTLLLPYFLLNLCFWTKVQESSPQKESKIDHLQALFLLSAIMISVIISL